MNIPFIKNINTETTTQFPPFKIQATDGDIFIVPNQVKTPLFIYWGHSDDDFSAIYMYLRKHFDTSQLSIIQITKSKTDKNVGLNNLFFTASKMELNKIENFKSEYGNCCYFLLDSDSNIVWSTQKPLNTAKNLQELRNIFPKITQNT